MMYFALLSVAFGSILNFGQIASLYYILDLDSYIAYRVVINTMTTAAPFLCFGFDNAAPILKRAYPNTAFFWNWLILQFALMIIFFCIALLLPATSSVLPFILGIGASTSVASTLIIANHYRSIGLVRKYFLNINITDKLIRFLLLISFACLTHNVTKWTLAITIASFIYIAYASWQTKTVPKFDISIFLLHFKISFPFIFSSLGVIALTRMPFYAAYFNDEKMLTAKIDVWLLFSLFILIPVLNKSKIEESNSGGNVITYINNMNIAWLSIMRQELIICLGIMLISIISVTANLSKTSDLNEIVLPLIIGMLLISSIPNYVQLICFDGKFLNSIKASLLIVSMTLVSYLPILITKTISVPILFIFSAFIYCMIGLVVAKYLKVPISSFWRWRSALLLGTLCCIGLTTANEVISLLK